MDIRLYIKFHGNPIIFTQVIVFTKSNIKLHPSFSKGHNSVNYSRISLIVELIRDLMDIRLHIKFHGNPIIFTQVIVFTKSNIKLHPSFSKGHNSVNYSRISLIVELIPDLMNIRLHIKFHENLIIFTQVIAFTRKT